MSHLSNLDDTAVIRIVDDDFGARNSLQELLESYGYKTQTFDSADAFLSDPLSDEPGCIVLDLQMPGMSGLELQQELASRGYSIPIVFLTGQSPRRSSTNKTCWSQTLVRELENISVIVTIHVRFRNCCNTASVANPSGIKPTDR